jgi:hypothetical protein
VFIPSEERRREIQQEARLFAQVFRIALDYAKADQGRTGEALLKAVKLSKPRPEEAEWCMRAAIKRAKELDRIEAERGEAETAALMKDYPGESAEEL